MKLQIFALLLATAVGHAAAQTPTYPVKPLRLIVSAGPGSVVDLRALAVADSRRRDAAPDVPTFAELGYPYMEGVSWQGIFVPAGTSASIVSALQAAIARTLQLPEIRNPMLETGSIPGGNSPEEFAAFIRADRARMGRMMKEANIAPE
jgi:tripartite-type tricarboxylate transporter receptor subunit TctC